MEQLAARRAHNPKVGGSSPPPATKADNSKELSASFFSAAAAKVTSLFPFSPVSSGTGCLQPFFDVHWRVGLPPRVRTVPRLPVYYVRRMLPDSSAAFGRLFSPSERPCQDGVGFLVVRYL